MIAALAKRQKGGEGENSRTEISKDDNLSWLEDIPRGTRNLVAGEDFFLILSIREPLISVMRGSTAKIVFYYFLISFFPGFSFVTFILVPRGIIAERGDPSTSGSCLAFHALCSYPQFFSKQTALKSLLICSNIMNGDSFFLAAHSSLKCWRKKKAGNRIKASIW